MLNSAFFFYKKAASADKSVSVKYKADFEVRKHLHGLVIGR